VTDVGGLLLDHLDEEAAQAWCAAVE